MGGAGGPAAAGSEVAPPPLTTGVAVPECRRLLFAEKDPPVIASLFRSSAPARGLLAAVLAVFTVSACTTPEPVPDFPDPSFTDARPFTFRAADVVVLSEFQPNFEPPRVEHLMPLPPERALRAWARDRLAVTGEGDMGAGLRTVRLVIGDARVTEERLDTSSGVTGFFTDEQAWRYTARIDVAVQVMRDREVLASATTEGSRTTTVSEKASLNEREEAWYALVTRLMEDFDQAMSQNVRQYLAEYTVAP